MESNDCKICEQIVTQIEYYFGDFNLTNDHFIKKIAQKDNGWVSIETLLKFNRLKALINRDKQLFIKSVKNSNSDLIELNEFEDKIRRKLDKPLPELSEDYKQSLDLRTVHVKGFPEDLTLDELMVWCKQYGEYVSIQMRRIPNNNKFKGCIFVIFNDKSMAENMINAEILKYKDNILLKENKIKYNERKREISAEKKRLRIEKLLEEKMNCESKNGIKSEGDYNQDMKDQENENPVLVESAVLKLKGLPRSIPFYKIKKYFKTHAKVSFVHKSISGNFCFIRFANKYDANNVLAVTKIQSEDKTVDKIVIDGNEAIAEVITGEEEKNFWIKTKKSIGKFLEYRKRNNKRVEKLVKGMKSKNRKRSSSDVKTNGSKQLKPINDDPMEALTEVVSHSMDH